MFTGSVSEEEEGSCLKIPIIKQTANYSHLKLSCMCKVGMRRQKVSQFWSKLELLHYAGDWEQFLPFTQMRSVNAILTSPTSFSDTIDLAWRCLESRQDHRKQNNKWFQTSSGNRIILEEQLSDADDESTFILFTWITKDRRNTLCKMQSRSLI